MPLLKAFLQQEAKDFEGLAVKYVRGATPTLIVYNDAGEETERVTVSNEGSAGMTRLLEARGIYRRRRDREPDVEPLDVEEDATRDELK